MSRQEPKDREMLKADSWSLVPEEVEGEDLWEGTVQKGLGEETVGFLLIFKPTFSLSSFTFIKRLFSSFHFLP